MDYIARVWNAFSKLVNVALLMGEPSESVSARAYREQWPVEGAINALFGWQNRHCRGAYAADRARAEAYLGLPKPLE